MTTTHLVGLEEEPHEQQIDTLRRKVARRDAELRALTVTLGLTLRRLQFEPDAIKEFIQELSSELQRDSSAVSDATTRTYCLQGVTGTCAYVEEQLLASQSKPAKVASQSRNVGR